MNSNAPMAAIPREMAKNKTGRLRRESPGVVALSYQDSNLDRQNQKLQCYHYTIRQSVVPKLR